MLTTTFPADFLRCCLNFDFFEIIHEIYPSHYACLQAAYTMAESELSYKISDFKSQRMPGGVTAGGEKTPGYPITPSFSSFCTLLLNQLLWIYSQPFRETCRSDALSFL